MENHDIYLSDWLDGKISDEELRRIVGETEFAAYEKLKMTIDQLQVAEPDLERNYAAIKQKKIAGLKPTRVIPLHNYLALAASLIILFGLFQLFVFSNHVETGIGRSASIEMADGTFINMNSKSCLEYPSLFKYNRKLTLDGEAYFSVKKGGKFVVQTNVGKVEVLGTKFNVIARDNYFEVICYEGKVSVSHENRSNIIVKGQAVRFYQDNIEQWTENNPTPLWLSGESGFRNSPLQIVIEHLENQYNYEIEYPASLSASRFTGSFTHNNIDTALKTICIPLNLKYSKTETGKIIISE
ncbi:MAG TPA: FecR domain-containing protein [Flavobacterium sp.]|jgi:ferric-dicitrate binding protein FerR (iron transport regulator)